MERQKQQRISEYTNLKIDENKPESFNRVMKEENSFAVFEDGTEGIYYTEGKMSDDEGFKKADDNLALERPYKFSLETGKRSRDLTKDILTGEQIKQGCAEILDYLNARHPDFIIKEGEFSFYRQTMSMTNSLGLDYKDTDGYTSMYFSFKHKDSKDITDGYISMQKREFDINKFISHADNILDAFCNKVELPDEIILQDTYYGYLSEFYKYLDAESIALGTSLFAGKLGQQVFDERFSLRHDVSDKKAWTSPFFDGEGVTLDGDSCTYIENGVILKGYADKRIADKYGVPHTGSAVRVLSDIPQNGGVNFHIEQSEKSARELLDGRLTVYPIMASGGGFNEKGDYVMPIQTGLLCDGEKFIGRLPEFTIAGNLFEMFGSGFIGVTKDETALGDKSILMKMKVSK